MNEKPSELPRNGSDDGVENPSSSNDHLSPESLSASLAKASISPRNENASPLLDINKPGHANNLTAVQRHALFVIWAKLLESEELFGQAIGGKLSDGQAIPSFALPQNAAITSSSSLLNDANGSGNLGKDLSRPPSTGSQEYFASESESIPGPTPNAAASKGWFSRWKKSPSSLSDGASTKDAVELSAEQRTDQPSISLTVEDEENSSENNVSDDSMSSAVEIESSWTSYSEMRIRRQLLHNGEGASSEDDVAGTPNGDYSIEHWRGYSKTVLRHQVLIYNETASPSEAVANMPIKTTYSIELWRGLLNGFADPDGMLLKFLRARKWNMPLATNMLLETAKWRATTGVFDLTMRGEMAISETLLRAGKTFFHAYDKQGRLVIYILVRLHEKNAQTLEESKLFTVYQMEAGRRLMKPGTETVTLVFDMTNFTMASMSYYPECLAQCLIVNAPWLFWGCWKIIKIWLDPVVASKILFLKKEELRNYIDEEVLLKDYFGKDSYVYSYEGEISHEHVVEPEDDEVMKMKAEVVQLKESLVSLTNEIIRLISQYGLESPLSKSSLNSASSAANIDEAVTDLNSFWQLPEVQTMVEARDAVKLDYMTASRNLESKLLPKIYYHHIGVIDETTGIVDWSKAVYHE